MYFILAILILSTAGYAFFSNEGASGGTSGGNNGLQNVGDRWAWISNGNTHYSTHSLENTANVSVNFNLGLSDYSEQNLYIASESEQIYGELAYNLGFYVLKVQGACYGNCTKDLPEKDCTELLIVWTQNQENRVYQNNKCIFIDGDLRAVDAFIYKLFGFK